MRTHPSEDIKPLLDVKARVERLVIYCIVFTGAFFVGSVIRSLLYPPLTRFDLACLLVLFTGFSVLAWSLQNCARFIAVSAAPRAARLVFRDERTGLYTARYMLERLQHEVSRSARYSSTFSVLYVRLRGLETWAAGACQPERDAFWHDLAFSIRTVTRRADLAAHWSADSLLMFLPNTEFLSGYMLAERLEEILGEADTLRARRGPMAWRPEIGCATYPYDGKDARELIRYAELAAHRGINTHAGCNPLTGRITSCDL